MRVSLLFFVVLFHLNVVGQFWKIGIGYKIAFSSNDVSGIFKELEGTIAFDSEALGSSKFDLKIKIESISTGNAMMNGHAKGVEWFDAERYPHISFVSGKVDKTANGYVAVGKLEMKGIKKDITIPFTFVKKGSKATIVAKFAVDRTDFGIGKKGNDVSEALKISTTIPVTRK